MLLTETRESKGSAPHERLLVRLAEQEDRWLSFLTRRSDSSVAEDLLHIGLERAATKLQTLRDPERLEAWFFKILRRVVAEHHTQQARDRKRQEALLTLVDTDAPEEVAVCGCALGLVDHLPPSQKAVLDAVDLQDEGISEVAARLGTSANNASVRLHRARARLRALLEAQCSATSLATCLDCEC